MTSSIIACVKQEEKYIKEWIDYHLSLGFNHFFLADNNDSNYAPSLQSVVLEYIDKGIIDIISFHNIHPIQPVCYNRILELFGEDYDWYAIIDVDEFIALPRDKNINNFLLKFDDTDIIYLHWQYYGDNDLLAYENKPVQERFPCPTKKPFCGGRCSYIKSIFRKPSVIQKHLSKPFEVVCQHSILGHLSEGDKIVRKNCLGEIDQNRDNIGNVFCKYLEYGVAYIKHYITKSLEEWIWKSLRGGALQENINEVYDRYNVERFFDYNTLTEEKLDFLKSKYNLDLHYIKYPKIEEFNFCYIIDKNEEQLQMLKNSINSLIDVFGQYSPTIYVVYIENEDDLFNSLLKLYFLDTKDADIKIKHLDKNICKMILIPQRAKNSTYLGFNSLIRFFLPYILDCNYVYYVDTDILFIKDFYKKLVYFDYEDTLLRGWIQHTSTEECDSDHFNAGFMFINCKKWINKKEIMPGIMNYYIQNSSRIEYMNQSCYEWLIKEKYPNICIIENDVLINSRSLCDEIELFHGNGRNKQFYWDGYNKFKHDKDDTSL